jgi:hypothetical protein
MQNSGVKNGDMPGRVGITARHCQKNEGGPVGCRMNEEMSTNLFSIYDRIDVSGK